MEEKNKHYYILNFITIGFYFLIFFSLKIGINHDVMFHTLDSQTYLEVANWLGKGVETQSTSIRPIFYPLLLLLLSNIYIIWFFQFIVWVLTSNLTFWSVYKLTKRNDLAYLSTLIIISNLTLIALTLHALTEVLVTFLLSLLIYFIVKNIERAKDLSFIHICILILIILTITKPVFLIPLLITLFLILPVFYLKKYIKTPIKLFVLLIILLPLIFQISLMKKKHNTFNVSNVGILTFKEYFLTKGIGLIENIDREQSLKKANSLTTKEQTDYILNHKKTYFCVFLSNVIGNVIAPSSFMQYPLEYKHDLFRVIMILTNFIYFFIHLIFIFPILYLFNKFIKNKNYNELILLSIMTFLSWYIILISGIAFWQGDRLVLPSIVIWSCLYAFTASNILKLHPNIELYIWQKKQ